MEVIYHKGKHSLSTRQFLTQPQMMVCHPCHLGHHFLRHLHHQATRAVEQDRQLHPGHRFLRHLHHQAMLAMMDHYLRVGQGFLLDLAMEVQRRMEDHPILGHPR